MIDWPAVAELLEGLGGQPATRRGRRRSWHVPSPTGGSFAVEVPLSRRWCSVAVDRYRTTDRSPTAHEWFEERVWPHVRAGLAARRGGYGCLPTGAGAWSSASPLDRAVLLEVLAAWVAQELTWGLPREEMGWERKRVRHDPRPPRAQDASAAWPTHDQAAPEKSMRAERLQDMTNTASKRHRWPTHDNHGGRIECE